MLKGGRDLVDERNQTIDILRGIAAISVILGHSIQRGMSAGFENNILVKLIYTYHMPLFILLSGYTLYLSNPKWDSQFIIKKVKRLLLPTIVWSYLLYFARNISFTGLYVVNFPNSLWLYTRQFLLHPDALIWFLYIVFLCILFFILVKRWLANI